MTYFYDPCQPCCITPPFNLRYMGEGYEGVGNGEWAELVEAAEPAGGVYGCVADSSGNIYWRLRGGNQYVGSHDVDGVPRWSVSNTGSPDFKTFGDFISDIQLDAGDEGYVVVCCENLSSDSNVLKVVLLDASNGSIVWELNGSDVTEATIQIAQYGGDYYVVALADPATATKIFKITGGASGGTLTTTYTIPAYTATSIAADGSGGFVLGSAAGAALWNGTFTATTWTYNHNGTMSFGRANVYVAGGKAYSTAIQTFGNDTNRFAQLNLSTGSEIWRAAAECYTHDAPTGTYQNGLVEGANGDILAVTRMDVGGTEHKLLLSIDSTDGSTNWTFIHAPTSPSPHVASHCVDWLDDGGDGKMFYGGDVTEDNPP